MKITLMTLVEARPGIATLTNHKFSNAKSAYWVSKIVKRLATEYDAIDATQKLIVEQLGLTNVTKEKPATAEQEKEFKTKWDDFIKDEIELDIPKLKFEQVEAVQFSGRELAFLDWLIEEPVEK